MNYHELKVELFGRVQGVGFRQYVKKQADLLRLSGYVRNRDDGSVLVIAQGPRKVLEELLAIIQRGPFLSKVSGVSYVWRTPLTRYSDFVISVNKDFISDQAASFSHLGKVLMNSPVVPRHIALIPDGNRRWARERRLGVSKGHEYAARVDRALELIDECKKLGVYYFTIWGFSTENWKRDTKEVYRLVSLVSSLLKKFANELPERNIRFRHLGREDRLPAGLDRDIRSLEEKTAHCTGFYLQFCFDYGGRDEIARAVNKILKSGVKTVSEEDFSHYLDSEGIPDPDLIIRTSGERRTSGFMPFQSTYAEWYFTDVYFPEFGSEQLRAAVEEFAVRKRNFGK